MLSSPQNLYHLYSSHSAIPLNCYTNNTKKLNAAVECHPSKEAGECSVLHTDY